MSWKPLLSHPLFTVETRLHEGRAGPFPVARLRTADWVNVVPVTPDGDVVLVRQLRFGIEAETLEIPGGIVEEGEDPMVAAARELREETGFSGGRWTALGSVRPNPAIQSNRTWLFLAEGVERADDQALDPTEDITVELHPFTTLRELLESGRIDHALAVVSLQRVLLRP